MGKGKKWSADEVAVGLRRLVVEGEFTNGRVTERDLQSWFPASRHTVRFALSMLKAEGLIASDHGVGWHSLNYETSGSFETFANMFECKPRAVWPTMVADLLTFRARQFVAGVDGLLQSAVRPSSAADLAVTVLRSEKWGSDVLLAEDYVFAELLSSGGNLLDMLQAHQLRRTFERVRAFMPPSRYLEPRFRELGALLAAIDEGDRPLALRLAESAVTARNPLYMRLAHDAATLPAAGGEPESPPAQH